MPGAGTFLPLPTPPGAQKQYGPSQDHLRLSFSHLSCPQHKTPFRDKNGLKREGRSVPHTCVFEGLANEEGIINSPWLYVTLPGSPWGSE